MSNDITSIKQTLASYCHLVDRGEPAAVAALFAEDAVLAPYYDGDYEVSGRPAIQGWYEYYEAHFKSGIRHLKHLIHSIAIEVDGNSASGSCYLTAYMISNADGLAYQAQGTYVDQYAKRNDQWLFKRREIYVEFVTACGTPIEHMEPLGYQPE